MFVAQGTPTLSRLSLHANNIADVGATAMALFLRKNTTLTSLDLHANQVSDDGGVAMAEALMENEDHRLVKLDLRVRNTGPVGFRFCCSLSLSIAA